MAAGAAVVGIEVAAIGIAGIEATVTAVVFADAVGRLSAGLAAEEASGAAAGMPSVVALTWA